MWTRRELKKKAKKSLNRNYIVTVFVSLILLVILNASSYYSTVTEQLQKDEDGSTINAASTLNQTSDTSGLGIFSGLLSGSQKTLSDDYFGDDEEETGSAAESADASTTESAGMNAEESAGAAQTEVSQEAETLFPGVTYEEAYSMEYTELLKRYWAYTESTYKNINWKKTIPVSVFWLLFQIFIGDIFTIGGCHFFVENADHKARPKELLRGFRGGCYWRNVVTMFFMNLKIFLWYLLLFVPGIVKSLEYRMVPYLLAEYPELDRKEAFRISKNMMQGEKWNVFVLDLSFILWIIADYICYGWIGILYFRPYKYSTNAELYIKLKELNGMGTAYEGTGSDFVETEPENGSAQSWIK